MANILAAASGNWSATATWTGGVLPGAGDTAVANGKTVEIDQDITVALLSNTTTGGAVAGGGFVVGTSLTSGTRNISVTSGLGNVAGTYIGATGALLTISASAGTVAMGTTAIKGGSVSLYRALDITSTVTVTGSGQITSGTQASAYAVNVSGNAIVSLGNCTGGSANVPALFSQNATVTVGNITAGAGGLAMQISDNTSLTCGAVTGSAGGGTAALSIAGNSTITCASVTGGSGTNARGIDMTTNSIRASLTVTGATTAATGPAINVTASSGTTFSFDLQGGVVASGTAAALDTGTIECLVRVAGPITWGANNYAPLRTPRWFLAKKTGTVTTMTIKDDSATPNTGANVTFSTANGGTRPSAADVRSGTAFDATTGTCAIPAASNVGYGVPVDNTTGTAVLTPAAAWAYEIDTGVSAATRLLNGATVASTQAQLAAGAA